MDTSNRNYVLESNKKTRIKRAGIIKLAVNQSKYEPQICEIKWLKFLSLETSFLEFQKYTIVHFMENKEKKGGFWGVSIFKKAKDLFTNAEIDEDEIMSQETKHIIISVSYLDYLSKEIQNHVAVEEIAPIITHQKFHSICVDKFGLNLFEKKVIEKHLLKIDLIKYSKATITLSKSTYEKEFKVIRFLHLNKLRVIKEDYSPSMMNPNKISEIHLMLFELELNHSELKNGLVQVEGRKEFLENEINFLVQNIQPITDDKRDRVKLDTKKLRLFDHVWMKLSQCIALIDEEIPRIKEFRSNIPQETIRMFVVETRKDMKNFEDAMSYVETIELNEIPQERIPCWFEGEEEITDEELEQEFWKDIETESEIDNVDQYDSIIEKLRANIRNHTQSFYEESKGLDFY